MGAAPVGRCDRKTWDRSTPRTGKTPACSDVATDAHLDPIPLESYDDWISGFSVIDDGVSSSTSSSVGAR